MDETETDKSPSSNMSDSKGEILYGILASILQDAELGDVAVRMSDSLRPYNMSLDPRELEYIKKLVLPKILGHKHQPLNIVIPITILYSIIFVTGVVGNFCTCLVIMRNKYMRTVTNYYLFNLSISDLLLLIMGLPMEVYHTWSAYPFPFGEAFCRFRFWASEVSSNVSVLTITAFTIERYLAICHPIKFPTHPGLSRPLRVMAAVWFLSSLWSIALALQMGVSYKKWNREKIDESAMCEMLNPSVGITVFQPLVSFPQPPPSHYPTATTQPPKTPQRRGR